MSEREILERSIKNHQAAIDKAKKDLDTLEVTYSIGDRIKYKDGSSCGKYIIVAISDSGCRKVSINRLDDGHGATIKVGNWHKITQSELDCFWASNNMIRYWDNRKKVRV